MSLIHGFFESQKVHVSSHTSKSIPFGVCIRRECVLHIERGGTHVLYQERAITPESKPEPLLYYSSFYCSPLSRLIFEATNLRILKEWSVLNYAYPERFPTKRKKEVEKRKRTDMYLFKICPLILSILNQFEKYYMPKGHNNI